MTRNPVKTSGTQSGSAALWRSLRVIATILAACLLGAAIGMVIAQTLNGSWRFGWGLLILVLLNALEAIVVERVLRESSLVWKWRCRGAFLLSMGLSWLFLGILSLGSASREITFLSFGTLFAAAFVGALAGGLWVTTVETGLWENNSPPPTQIEQEVYRLHQQIIGEGDAVSWSKRGFDLLMATLGTLISAPIWLASITLVWLEDPGPVLFVKNSVARGGKNFRQYKLRTMVLGAEEHSGPVLAGQKDQRVLKAGRILRKTALDELPQLINIFRGEMSFVGPRPQRTVLVQGYLQRMPEYAERHRVLPGLSGLAQVAGDYYLTPRQKLRFDRLYIRYSGLGYDLLLLYLAFLITFWYRWQADWDGRLPRRYLHTRDRRS